MKQQFRSSTLTRLAISALLVASLSVGYVPLISEEHAGTAFGADSPADPPTAPPGDHAPSLGEPPDGFGGGAGAPPDEPGGNSNQPPGSQSGQPDQPPAGGLGQPDTQTFDYQGSYSSIYTVDGTNETSEYVAYASTESDENAVLVEHGGTLTLKSADLQKSGNSDNVNDSNFYGVNAVLLALGSDSKVSTMETYLFSNSEGSNALFATDSGTIFAEAVTVETQANSSRGMDATYGGTIVANESTLTTGGDHCAGLATDRGGGNVSVTHSRIDTAGSGSPILYSTGIIEASDVTGTASGSQLAGVEGRNCVRVYDSTLSSKATGPVASDPIANGVIIFQSTSGDASTTSHDAARFEVCDSKLSSSIASGAMFYITNNTAEVVLDHTDLDFDANAANLLEVTSNNANNWGTPGRNGGHATFTGRDQTLKGTIKVDTVSSLDFYLLDNSTYTGSTDIVEIESTESATAGPEVGGPITTEPQTTGSDMAGSDMAESDAVAPEAPGPGTGEDTADESAQPLTMNIARGCTWVLPSNCTVNALHAEDGSFIVDQSGRGVDIVVDGKTVINGESDVTLTVIGTYDTTVTTTEANQLSPTTIDRTAFDQEFGTNTAFGPDDQRSTSNSSSASTIETAPSTEGSEHDDGFFGWLANLWDSFLGLFGL